MEVFKTTVRQILNGEGKNLTARIDELLEMKKKDILS
jgi:hypothetical protein